MHPRTAVCGLAIAVAAVAPTPGEAAASPPVFQGVLALPPSLPYRLSAGPDGRLYVVDARTGQVTLLTPRGDVMGAAALPAPARAVAASPRGLFVSLRDGRIARVDPDSGLVASIFATGFGNGAAGLAWEPTRGLLWAAEYEGGEVRAYGPDGALVARASSAGGVRLDGVVDVAVDEVHGLVWATLESHENGALVHGFDLDGVYRTSMISFGSGPGQVTRAGGIAVDPAGQIYVSDIFQGYVQVVTAAGAPVGTIGSWGAGAGQLRQPAGMTFLANGDLVVADMMAGRLDRFGTGAPLPTCQVAGQPDTDCDGLPDWWELKYGLNPYWAGDALLDLDSDGLTNLQEFAWGTDPRNPDTDGDGFTDGWEVANGFSPTDPTDHLPVLVASGPPETDPGLVRISSTVARTTAACTYAWKELWDGTLPPVLLLGAASASPSFVARAAGVYTVQGVATCGGATSAPAAVAVRVREVAPRPDPGRLKIVRNARPFTLDGGFSSDANGGALRLAWDQTLGRPVAEAVAGATLTATSHEPGYFTFQLTATDPAGLSASAEVPVLVVDAESLVPTAVAVTPVVARAGDRVQLDATASWARRDGAAGFSWSQVLGPPVALDRADGPTPSFVAAGPGRWAFEVSLVREGRRSPPARVDVYVAEAGGALPSVAAERVEPAVAMSPVTLRANAGATSGSPSYRWRQIAGPAAGLTDADRAVATVVPFEPGAYAFEVTVLAGGAESLPARVLFTATSPGSALPSAIARAPATALAGERVRLDGASSTGAVRYRWTQVGGPWVALDDPSAAAPSFHPRTAGAYVFELEVDDGAPIGAIRSAPAVATVLVLSRDREDESP